MVLPPAPSFADDCRRAETDIAARLPDLLDHWTKRLTPLPPPVTLPGARSRPAIPDVPRRRRAARVDGGNGRRRRGAGSPRRGDAVRRLFRRIPGRSFTGSPGRTTSPSAPRSLAARGRTRKTSSARWSTPSFCGPIFGASRRLPTCSARTRRTVHDALAHQDLPFDVLVGELRPHRDGPTGSGAAPLFQVLFNYSPGAADAGRSRRDVDGRAGPDRDRQV